MNTAAKYEVPPLVRRCVNRILPPLWAGIPWGRGIPIHYYHSSTTVGCGKLLLYYSHSRAEGFEGLFCFSLSTSERFLCGFICFLSISLIFFSFLSTNIYLINFWFTFSSSYFFLELPALPLSNSFWNDIKSFGIKIETHIPKWGMGIVGGRIRWQLITLSKAVVKNWREWKRERELKTICPMSTT